MEFVRVTFALLFVLFCGVVVSARTPQKRWAVDDDGCRTPDKGVGICTRISECQPMVDFLKTKQSFTEKEQNILKSYRCGVYGNEPKVCCPNSPIDLGWAVDEDRCDTPDGSQGICLGIKDCKIIYNYIDSHPVTDIVRETLNKYICGSDSLGYKICCPSTLPRPLIEDRISDDTQHPNYNLLTSVSCGNGVTEDKITNGNETGLFEFPWAAALKYDKKVNPWSCGGSLISERYILTAAHCIKSKNRLTTVRLGEHNFTSSPDCIMLQQEICADPHQDFEISADDTIVHPGYNPNTLQDDIALIRLPRKPDFRDNVAPVCLPVSMKEKTTTFKNYTVIGWGATETGFGSSVLLKVQVPRVEIPECAPNYAPRTLTDNQICAGGRNEQDSCAGDSGGPLMADFTTDGPYRTIQYGIVSLGPRICGREGFPAVYTRVEKYIGWILNNIKP